MSIFEKFILAFVLGLFAGFAAISLPSNFATQEWEIDELDGSKRRVNSDPTKVIVLPSEFTSIQFMKFSWAAIRVLVFVFIVSLVVPWIQKIGSRQDKRVDV